MSQHMFGIAKGAHLSSMSDETRERIEAIAQQHDAELVGPVNIPGNGWQAWFTCRNLGFPFDRATERAVRADIEADDELVAALGWEVSR